MATALVFGVTLFAAVLISGAARRSVLSTTVLFLIAGLATGQAGFDVIDAGSNGLYTIAELALFAVLFTDGRRVRFRDPEVSWTLPLRALGIGLPVTVLAVAIGAWWLTGLAVAPAILLGVVLAPTDPVFAEAIIGQAAIPFRVRHLLNVESGLNDGMALPAVIVLIDLISEEPVDWAQLAVKTVGGLALGAAMAGVFVFLVRLRWTSVTRRYEPLGTVALAIVIFATAGLTGANEFLAAFAAGVTLANLGMDGGDDDVGFDGLAAELLKLAAVLVFASQLSSALVSSFAVGDYVFVLAVLLLSRPLALGLALAGTGLDRREWLTVAWFGPKGFASILYALLVLDSGIPGAQDLFHLAGAVVALSIVLHSSTDTLVARSFRSAAEQPDR